MWAPRFSVHCLLVSSLVACEAKAPTAAGPESTAPAKTEPAKEETAKVEPVKEDAEKEDAEKEDAEKEDAEKEDAEKEDAEKEDAEKEDAEKEDAEKEDEEKEDEEKEDEEKDEPSPPVAAPVGGSTWSSRVQPASLPAKAPPTSILGQAHAHGEPVAIVSSDAGLTLVSLKGMKRTLVAGDVDQAIYEPRTGVLLFLRDKTLYGVDLYAPLAEGATPEVVALTKPAKGDLDWPELEIHLPDKYWVSSSKDEFSASLSLSWGAEPGVSWSAGMSYDDFEEGEATPEPEIKLSNAQWLNDRAERLAWPKPGFGPLEFSYQPEENYKAPPGYDKRCFDWSCGEALPLGASGLELVITADDFGDVAHILSIIRDPAKQRYIAFSAWLEGTDAWFPASELTAKLDEQQDEHTPFFETGGRVFAPYLGADELCTTAVSCSPVGGSVIDFIAGGVEIGPTIPQR